MAQLIKNLVPDLEIKFWMARIHNVEEEVREIEDDLHDPA